MLTCVDSRLHIFITKCVLCPSTWGFWLRISGKYGSTSIAWSVIAYPTLKQREYLRLLSLTKGTFVENWGFGDLAAPNADFVTFGNAFGAYAGHQSGAKNTGGNRFKKISYGNQGVRQDNEIVDNGEK